MSWEQAPSPTRNLRLWLWPGIAVVALIAIVAFILLARADRPPGTLTIGPTAEPAGGASAAPSANPSDFVPTPLNPSAISTEVAGDGPLLPDGPDVTVVIADDQHVHSINIATGDIHRSPLGPRIDPWTFFAVGDRVITNAAENVVAISNVDHRLVRLARNHYAMPTVDDASVWVLEQGAVSTTAALRVGFDGTVRRRVELPAIAQPRAGVGDSVFVWTPSGIHTVSGGGIRRITSSGLLLAVSTDRLAWFDCAADLTCQIVIGTHDGPDQVRMPAASNEVPGGFGFALGKFSPDGRRLALPMIRLDADQAVERATVVIIDTVTGAEVTRLPERVEAFEGTPLDWSPDGQWLFVASGPRVLAWNATNGELTRLDPRGSGPIRGLAVIENQ